MPNIKSAIKRFNTIKTKTEENSIVKTAYKTAIKKFMKDVEEKNYDKALVSFKAATKAVDKAADKGVIKANTAARKKSSLAKALNTIK